MTSSRFLVADSITGGIPEQRTARHSLMRRDGVDMSHPGPGEQPARWRLIEATNGYDVDNGVIRDQVPAAPVRVPRRRGGFHGQAVTRFLLGLAAAYRRQRESDEPSR